MSDDKKSEKPLEETEILVQVIPKDNKNPSHRDAAKKLEEKVKGNVKKAVEESKSGGKEKQFDAAKQETKKAGEGTSNEKIKKINVGVIGKDEEGDREQRGWSVNPKEGKPTP